MQRGVLLTLLTARSFLLLLAPTGECSRAVVVVSAALVLLVKPSLCFLTVGASAALRAGKDAVSAGALALVFRPREGG